MSLILWEAFILLSFVFVAGIFFIIDDKIGTAIRAFFYKLTHKEGLPEGKREGYIEGKTTAQRFWPIILVGSFSFYIFKNMFAVTLLGMLTVYIVALFGTALGFMAGPWFCRIFGKKDKALEVIGKLETGEINIPAKVSELAGRASQSVSEIATKAAHETTEYFSEAATEAIKYLHRDIIPDDEPKQETPAPEIATIINEATKAEEPSDLDKAREGIEKFIKG